MACQLRCRLNLLAPKISPIVTLNNTDKDDFEAGAVDTFEVTVEEDVGEINGATVRKGPSSDDYWDLQWIWIENHTTDSSVLLAFHPAKDYPRSKLLKKANSPKLEVFK